MIKQMNLNAENHVVMSNDLIKSKSNLSLNEIKLLRLAIMQVVKEDHDFSTYKISIMELAKLLEIDHNHIYWDVEKICDDLMGEVVTIRNGKNWKKFQWCSSCQYQNGTITIRLHDELKPYLLELKELYTQYMLSDVLMLKTTHSIRIYELLREQLRYQKVFGNKQAKVYLSVKEIRSATNTENKYEKASMFRSRVIESAVNEINEKLSYEITFEPVKESRKITGYNFTIKSKWAKYEKQPRKE